MGAYPRYAAFFERQDSMNVNTNFYHDGRFSITTYGVNQAATLTEFGEPGVVKHVRSIPAEDVYKTFKLIEAKNWRALGVLVRSKD